jgi:hypothetical protein
MIAKRGKSKREKEIMQGGKRVKEKKTDYEE